MKEKIQNTRGAMKFNNEFCISDIVSIISLLLVITGGVFAYYQWRRDIALKRANYINELTEKIRTDDSIKDVVYLLDYDDHWYSKEFHGSGKLELKMDKTLSYFSYICYLRKQRIISNKEFDFFRYEIERILKNQQVQDYFFNLYHFCNQLDTPMTFKFLFEYGESKKVFDEVFYDKNAYMKDLKYHHYLNF